MKVELMYPLELMEFTNPNNVKLQDFIVIARRPYREDLQVTEQSPYTEVLSLDNYLRINEAYVRK
jgi:hypothetical protein